MIKVERIADSDLGYRIDIEVPTEQVNEAYQKRLNELSKQVDLKGFRKGKVPPAVIETKFGKGVRQEVANEVIQNSFQKAIEENKLNIAGMPNIDAKDLVKGQPFLFSATFEVYPEIDLTDLTGVEIEKTVCSVDDTAVNEMIEKIRTQQASWAVIDRVAADKDRVTIDFVGYKDGEEFEGGSSKDFKLILGSKQMIEGFEDALIGTQAGDNKEVTLTFPESYAVQDLAGKETLFKITVHQVEAPSLPELNDEFAKKLGFEDGVEALKEDIEKNMQSELKTKLHNTFKTTILEKLLEKNPIAIPDALIDIEINHMQKMTMQQMAAQQGKKELPKIDLPKEPFMEEAKKRVSLGLLVAEVIKKHDIKSQPEQVRARVEEMAASYKEKEQVISWYYNNKQMMAEIEAAVLEDQAVEKLLESATIKEQVITYNEATQDNQQGK